ncbi:uncharacterized protein LOC124947785 [Vespa velutina]|uniref:uncharacterized protein LOC124947785 n=1 Tax=Vespa velutina TaxID=202808 RepID=UPI001FB265AA|nr:uncharacterized protein LOC124947785 [Vespa velutina]
MRSWNNRPDEPRFRRTERYTMPSSSFSSNLHREATEDEGQQDLGVPTLEIPTYASDGHRLTYRYTVLARCYLAKPSGSSKTSDSRWSRRETMKRMEEGTPLSFTSHNGFFDGGRDPTSLRVVAGVCLKR